VWECFDCAKLDPVQMKILALTSTQIWCSSSYTSTSHTQGTAASNATLAFSHSTFYSHFQAFWHSGPFESPLIACAAEIVFYVQIIKRRNWIGHQQKWQMNMKKKKWWSTRKRTTVNHEKWWWSRTKFLFFISPSNSLLFYILTQVWQHIQVKFQEGN